MLVAGELKLFVQMAKTLGLQLGDLGRRNALLREQLLGEELAQIFAPGDCLIQARLSKARFVALVMTETPVAIQIDDNVVMKCGAKVESHFYHVRDRLRFVAVDVKYRNV